MDTIYLNGQFVDRSKAQVSVMDRGFLFGDGIYEVIPVFAGKLFRLHEHMVRLENSLKAVKIPNPMSHEKWQEMFEALIEENGGGNLGLYMQVTRGAVEKRDHAFPQDPKPTIFAMVSPMPNPKPIESIEGIKAITVDDIRWHRCDIKSIALLGNTMLRQAAVEKGAAESILIRDGKATEGAGSNLFIVDNDGTVITPPHSNNLLGGITRDLIVELCHKNNIACKEVDVSVDELKNAAEIWMSSSTKEILPVLELDGQQVGNGQIGDKWKEVFKVYQAFKKEVESGDAS